MNPLVQNENSVLFVCLNMLKMFGFLVPGHHSKAMKMLLRVYWWFWFLFIVGIYIIVQFGDLVQIWGDLPLMVSTSVLLFTNCALAGKLLAVGWRSDAVQVIIDEGREDLRSQEGDATFIVQEFHRHTKFMFISFASLSAITVLGWAVSADKNSLPVRAWYPYDTNLSPAYEITYLHQTLALFLAAILNVSLDIMMTTLIALCRCRLRLVALSLSHLGSNLDSSSNDLILPKAEQEALVSSELRVAVTRHQAALRSAADLQACFSEPILGQFAVSMVIICVTAYQLAMELQQSSKHAVRIVSMTAYLLCMMQQVFLYCYQGNQISLESSAVSTAAYSSLWYRGSLRTRRSLLLVMLRTRRPVELTAGSLTRLSLATFTSIIKASYTFFTVLQHVEKRKTTH